jgi:hypothetical protein
MNEYLAWPIVALVLFLIAYFTLNLQFQFWSGRTKDNQNPENNFWSGAFIFMSLLGALIMTFTCVGMIAFWQGQWVYLAYAAILIVAALAAYRGFKAKVIDTPKKDIRKNLPIPIQKLINFFEVIFGIALGLGGVVSFIMSWATLTR